MADQSWNWKWGWAVLTWSHSYNARSPWSQDWKWAWDAGLLFCTRQHHRAINHIEKATTTTKRYKQYLCTTMVVLVCVFVDHFYIALFSALEQTPCTCMWFCIAFLQGNMWAKINTPFFHKLPLLAEREKGVAEQAKFKVRTIFSELTRPAVT